MAWDSEVTNVRYTEYVHGGVDNSDDFTPWYDACAEAGVDPDDAELRDARGRFSYALSEVRLDVEVDIDTGAVRCWGVEGVALVDPVDVG